MSVTFTHVEPPTETTFLRERVSRLRASLEWAGDAVSAKVRARVLESADRCAERLALGVDSTVVALAGGTGSGKSTLFNALASVDFAMAGVSRPTTAHVSAASWGGRATELLDWLGVDPERRLLVETGLDDKDEALRGLVLLDLPDHDSVARANRDIVDRVVPMADLLVWVVDPQKYADHALHSRYLADVAESGAPSAVVLNQIDRLTPADANTVLFDIRRLLAEQGIEEVPVVLVSASAGAGVETLRGMITGAVQKRSVAAQAVRAELVGAGKLLARALAKEAEPQMPDAGELAVALARAAGVDALAEACAEVAAGRLESAPPLGSLRPAAVDAHRRHWIEQATIGMPATWRRVLDRAVAKSAAIAHTVGVALAAVDWPEPVAPRKKWGRLRGGVDVSPLVLERGRAAVGDAILEDVLEPTETMHQSYRALDELSHLE